MFHPFPPELLASPSGSLPRKLASADCTTWVSLPLGSWLGFASGRLGERSYTGYLVPSLQLCLLGHSLAKTMFFLSLELSKMQLSEGSSQMFSCLNTSGWGILRTCYYCCIVGTSLGTSLLLVDSSKLSTLLYRMTPTFFTPLLVPYFVLLRL